MPFDIDLDSCWLVPLARQLEAAKKIVCWNQAFPLRELGKAFPRIAIANGNDRDKFFRVRFAYDSWRFPVQTAGRIGLVAEHLRDQAALIALQETPKGPIWPGPGDPNDFWFNT